MRKDYYYIDADGNHCELSTCNLEHQAKIESHLLKRSQNPDKKTMEEKTEIKSKKQVRVGDKVAEQDQDFLIVIEPFDLNEIGICSCG